MSDYYASTKPTTTGVKKTVKASLERIGGLMEAATKYSVKKYIYEYGKKEPTEVIIPSRYSRASESRGSLDVTSHEKGTKRVAAKATVVAKASLTSGCSASEVSQPLSSPVMSASYSTSAVRSSPMMSYTNLAPVKNAPVAVVAPKALAGDYNAINATSRFSIVDGKAKVTEISTITGFHVELVVNIEGRGNVPIRIECPGGQAKKIFVNGKRQEIS